ncbi:MAG TPA: hypothetical protein VMR16_02455 [Candidatus Saccharimonadales bacterium]|nr:hypothetical protein [Candidatus Saccharimonadales bacterium]
MNLSSDNNTLLEKMESWILPDNKIIIGIDGYSGAGKTTLAQSIEKRSDVFLVVNRDDFAIPRKEFADSFTKLKTEVEKVRLLVNNTIDVDELASFLKMYKNTNDKIAWRVRDGVSGLKDKQKIFDFSKKVLIIEGIFLFHSRKLQELIDKKIFIDTNIELADNRRRAREMDKWGNDYFPDTRPDSYSRLIKLGFIDYLNNERPMNQADLVIISS